MKTEDAEVSAIFSLPSQLRLQRLLRRPDNILMEEISDLISLRREMVAAEGAAVVEVASAVDAEADSVEAVVVASVVEEAVALVAIVVDVVVDLVAVAVVVVELVEASMPTPQLKDQLLPEQPLLRGSFLTEW